MAVSNIVQHGIRQAEIRNPIAQNAADLVTAVENGDGIAVAGKDDGDGQPGGSCADDGDPASV